MRNLRADDIISNQLSVLNQALAKHFSSDVLLFKAPIRFGLDDVIRGELEALHQPSSKRSDKLTVLIETNGGYIETCERIYNVFRKHYTTVDFIVPNYAYSAGTVLVMSGDNIYMDYYSILGPIDPQYETDDGKWVPGLGYLQKFKELVEKINNPNQTANATKAELAYLMKKFDPALLFSLEQAKSHSEALLQDWLSLHEFKNWTLRETSKKKVTPDCRRKRAREIAQILGNPERWHSHGRGIGIKELSSEEIKLKVVDFGADATLNKLIRPYYDLFIDYCRKMGAASANAICLHTKSGFRRV